MKGRWKNHSLGFEVVSTSWTENNQGVGTSNVPHGRVRATLAPAPAVRLDTVPLSHTRLQT